MRSSSLPAVSLVLAVVGSGTAAFQIPPRLNPAHATLKENTSLCSSQVLDDGEPIVRAAIESLQDDVSWMDLPKSRDDTEKSALPSAEIVIGRIAMVGAMGLFANEALYGTSVLEQVTNLVGMTQ